jgi:hypothetical protein
MYIFLIYFAHKYSWSGIQSHLKKFNVYQNNEKNGRNKRLNAHDCQFTIRGLVIIQPNIMDNKFYKNFVLFLKLCGR